MAHVLIIESDRILADNLGVLLKRAGHSFDWQRDPQAAVDSADKKIPDVVILDLILARRSGVEFLNEFRSYPEWQHLPVIIYSDISPEEFNLSGSFAQFGVVAYHRKSHSRMRDVINSVQDLAPVAL